VVDWVKTVCVHFITWSTIKVKDLDGYACRLHKHIHQSAHSHVLDFTNGRLNVRATIALQGLVDEWLKLFGVLLDPGTCEQLGERQFKLSS